MHDANIGFNEVAMIGNSIANAKGEWNIEKQAQALTKLLLLQEYGYGQLQEHLKSICQSQCGIARILRACGVNLLNLSQSFPYFLNEIAHGSGLHPKKYHFLQ